MKNEVLVLLAIHASCIERFFFFFKFGGGRPPKNTHTHKKKPHKIPKNRERSGSIAILLAVSASHHIAADESCLTLHSVAPSHPGNPERSDTGTRDEILLGNKGNCFEKTSRARERRKQAESPVCSRLLRVPAPRVFCLPCLR